MSADGTSQGGSGRELAGWLQIAAVALVVLAAIAATFALMSSGETGGTPPEARAAAPVRVIQPETVSHRVQVALTGTVTASAFIDMAPQVGGRITAVSPAVRAGGAFEAGETLFEVDRRDYEIAETRARAGIADARSALNQLDAEAAIARREWERMYPEREITPLAARAPQLEAARARLLAAEAELAQARLNLERTRVSFPFAGAVTESRIELGLLVAPGQPYGQVYAAEQIELVAPASPADLARLEGADGRAAQIMIEGRAAPVPGRVARVGARVDPRTRLVDVFIAPEADALPELRPGLFATITLDGPELDDVMRLPVAAVSGLDTIHRVADGRIERTRITVRARTADHVFAAPFDAGEGVIVSPVPDILLGRRAEIVAPPPERS
ncbi:efflux RND transporter periplasmic adaptor subunit [Hyphomonadaceae bacterium ML37]|nr:efflux RND transporter periplasmic adaptor subunit [Hyphomonadaceae bacterium ML37]